jgi:hypothetical protein
MRVTNIVGLPYITVETVILARNTLEEGINVILAESAGFGREETVYAMRQALAALYGREYKHLPVGQDYLDARRISDEIDAAAEEARDVAIARAEAREEEERDGMDWDNQ